MNNNVISFEQQTIKKVMIRILPFVLVLYIISYVDRINLGYAALEMNADLALSAEVFGLISGIFFIGYILFEIPSNILLERFGARLWISRIMISWGIVVILTGFVQSATHLYILRFLLGVAEAGFFPGILLYITYWFRAKERGKAYSLFLIALPGATLVGAPISTWIIDNISWFSLAGWRWMFILEGIFTVVFGLICLMYLTNRPKEAKWLTSDERNWLELELENERALITTNNSMSKMSVLKKNYTWLLAFTYFGIYTGGLALSFWTPTIIDNLSGQFSNTTIGLITMIPAIISIPVMVLWGKISDRGLRKKTYVIIPMILASLGMIGIAFSSNPYIAITFIAITTTGIYSFTGPFFAMVSTTFDVRSAAVGIAFVNTIASTGGFFGPTILGYFNLTGGMFIMCGFIVIGIILLYLVKENTAESRQNEITSIMPNKRNI